MTRVLIADDHPFLCAGVAAFLRGTGFDVVATASDGDVALSAIDREDPDIVILDVEMPGKGGIDILEHLRGQGDERPVVLLTARLNDKALLAAVRAGANGIVLKEGAEERLLDVLQDVSCGQRAIEPRLLDRALTLSLQTPTEGPLDKLTEHEMRIVKFVARGVRNREIAKALDMTEGSVKVRLYRIYEKLGVSNRTELAIMVYQQTDEENFEKI